MSKTKTSDAMTSEPKSPGVFASLRHIVETGVATFQTRLALAGIELEEEIQRLLGILLMALGLILFTTLGLLVFTLMLVLVVPEQQRVLALAILTAIYLAIAAGLWLSLKKRLTERPPIFEATLAELEKDRLAMSDAVSDASDEVIAHANPVPSSREAP